MKHFFLILIAAISIAACSKTTGSTNNAQNTSGSCAAAQLPPNDMRETQIFTSRFWVFEHWVDVDAAGGSTNKGRWYRMYPDGTYDGGHWEDHNDHGTWFLKTGEKYSELYIDSCIDDYKDGKWEIQGISGGLDAMSWVKTAEYGDGRAAMCKLMPLLSMPTKEQFGVQ